MKDLRSHVLASHVDASDDVQPQLVFVDNAAFVLWLDRVEEACCTRFVRSTAVRVSTKTKTAGALVSWLNRHPLLTYACVAARSASTSPASRIGAWKCWSTNCCMSKKWVRRACGVSVASRCLHAAHLPQIAAVAFWAAQGETRFSSTHVGSGHTISLSSIAQTTPTVWLVPSQQHVNRAYRVVFHPIDCLSEKRRAAQREPDT
jgi:hypothetical protein